ncbi:MAG: 3'-5' exonuclease domain-containing protein 2 [Prevotella sp.]|nr:3'-5' exonuclease domain-containing protein 2 [Prevotella sp.]
MKVIYSKFDKKLISTLPLVKFEGKIVVVVSENEAARAVDFLLSQPILGVDTETRPSFTKGNQHMVSLLQVATHDVCFLFRLNYLGISPQIKRLIEDTTVPKIGLSWHDDILQLKRRGDFTPGYFVDLQKHVGEIGVEDLSLQKLFANFFGMRISKNQQLSNWEIDILNDKQKVYAATDAWACIVLYEELMRLESTKDYQLIKTAEPVESKQSDKA